MRKVRKHQRIFYYKALINRVKTSDTIYPYEAKQEKKTFLYYFKMGQVFCRVGCGCNQGSPSILLPILHQYSREINS